jgi:signal transduction histidine kinase
MKLKTLRRQLLLQYLLTVGLLLAVSEVSLYVLSHWAGQRELDTALKKDIEKLAAAIELDEDGSVEIEGEHHWDGVRVYGRMSNWQILMEDGATLGRSPKAPGGEADLPALGGMLRFDEVYISDVAYDGSGGVRAARLRTVRRRPSRGGRSTDPPREMVFDIRAVVDRTALDEQLRTLAWYLTGGFPIVLALAAVGGYYLIERAVRPVEEAFQRERRFTGAASHELRTPLTALRGEIDVVLRHQRSAAEYEEAIRRMDALVSRMTGLVEGLLVLARADAGHLLSDTSEVSVATLEASIREVIRQLPDHQRVTVNTDPPEGMRVLGDGLLLTVAVRNLVENSLLYSPHGPVDLRITESPAGGLAIFVEDQGPGIPSEVLAAFDGKGVSQRIPRQRTGRGAGLGLSIARAIVQSHGGKILLENGPESGSRATIQLPAVARHKER